tara:strand:+ start:14035 stop:14517 length:483 start_codon:yes stop_codon:yes gene_type:complete
MKKIFFLSFFLFTQLGCGTSSDKDLTSCFIIIPNNLQFVRVSYFYINNIAYGGEDSLQYVIEIENDSNQPLNDLYLTINYKWRAALKDIYYYQGFLKGYKPFGQSSFPEKKKLRFTFNKKSSNRLVFTDSSGKHMSELTFFHSLHLKADRGSGTWGFPDP